MRTVVIEAFGGPEVLKLVERPQPQPGKGEVRIRVHAATVNPTDLLLRSGRSHGWCRSCRRSPTRRAWTRPE
ncbi:hypothetical protein [Nannocystis pusilla]|uniref:hypothetical protein n=1 Tax=Nannocystis pusilla TaxID=889268 RepID=UPI003B7E5379